MEYITDNAIIVYPAIVTGLVEVIKRTGFLENKWMPLIAIIIGIAGAWYLELGVLTGIILGLTSVGLFEVADKTVTEVKAKI